MLDLALKYTKLVKHLNGSTLENALIVRKDTTLALLTDLFGEEWREPYLDFARTVKKHREMGRAVLPLLACGVTVPDLPLFAHFLVADEVLKYRPPETVIESLQRKISKPGRTIRPR